MESRLPGSDVLPVWEKSGPFTSKRRGCLDSTFVDTMLGMEWLIPGSEHVGFSLNSVKRMSVKGRGRRGRRGAERGESRMLLSVVGFSYTLPSHVLGVFPMLPLLLGLSPGCDFGSWGNVVNGGRMEKWSRETIWPEEGFSSTANKSEAAGIAPFVPRLHCTGLEGLRCSVLVLDVLAKEFLLSYRKTRRDRLDMLTHPDPHTDDFDVSIFLTELSTPHAILTRQKLFAPTTESLKSNSGKMTGTREEPMDIDAVAGVEEGVVIREESQDEESMGLGLGDIPPTITAGEEKREKLFVSDSEDADDSDNSDDGGGFQTQAAPPSKRPNPASTLSEPTDSKDDKKKMGLRTTYDGFRIYGRILCLVVKRKGIVRGRVVEGGGGQAMMETFISTQIQREGMGGED